MKLEEDTIYFLLSELIGKGIQKNWCSRFEGKEHELFGKEGFEGQVAHVEQIERKLGIYDLAQFTPSV